MRATIDEQIASYVVQLSDKQKKVLLSVAKAFAEEESEHVISAEYLRELDKRTHELETGKVKGYTWEEVKNITRKSLSEIHNK